MFAGTDSLFLSGVIQGKILLLAGYCRVLVTGFCLFLQAGYCVLLSEQTGIT